jgi:transposase
MMMIEEIAEEPAELLQRVAALDIGKASLVCCVRVPHESRPGARRQEVRTYDTVTPALLELRDWLICQGVTRVVMEATSAYWKPPFYLLEDDIECWWSTPATSRTSPAGPRPTRPMRSGCASSPSAACCGPASSPAGRSGSCGT